MIKLLSQIGMTELSGELISTVKEKLFLELNWSYQQKLTGKYIQPGDVVKKEEDELTELFTREFRNTKVSI